MYNSRYDKNVSTRIVKNVLIYYQSESIFLTNPKYVNFIRVTVYKTQE